LKITAVRRSGSRPIGAIVLQGNKVTNENTVSGDHSVEVSAVMKEHQADGVALAVVRAEQHFRSAVQPAPSQPLETHDHGAE
jgi:hypothetical protein